MIFHDSKFGLFFILIISSVCSSCNFTNIEEKFNQIKSQTESQAISRNMIKPFKRYFVKNAEERMAVCNDGSPAAYYIKRGFQVSGGIHVAQQKWIIHLKGGGSCHTPEDCEARMQEDDTALDAGQWMHRMSSKSYKDTAEFGGIMNSDPAVNQHYHNFNRVYVMYCSSDSYTGDISAEDNGSFHFRGRRIIKAIIEDLKADHQLGESKHVLFTGSSAGGNGMIHNLDLVASSLPQARVRGVKDSGYAPGFAQEFGLQEQATEMLKERVDFWNQMLHPQCVSDNPEEEHKCSDIYYLLANSYINTPFFVYTDQTDPKKLEQIPAPRDEEQVNRLRDLVQEGVERFEYGAFSTDRRNHIAITSDQKFFHWKVDGLSYNDVLTNWAFKFPGRIKVIEYKD